MVARQMGVAGHMHRFCTMLHRLSKHGKQVPLLLWQGVQIVEMGKIVIKMRYFQAHAGMDFSALIILRVLRAFAPVPAQLPRKFPVSGNIPPQVLQNLAPDCAESFRAFGLRLLAGGQNVGFHIAAIFKPDGQSPDLL